MQAHLFSCAPADTWLGGFYFLPLTDGVVGKILIRVSSLACQSISETLDARSGMAGTKATRAVILMAAAGKPSARAVVTCPVA